MPEKIDDFLFPRRPTAERPLLGQTVLVVEDSRFASEALRLMCLRGGARIRRADSLRAAARHLESYRPSVVVVDMGLPDGSGTQLIEALDAARPRVQVLLATSGDPGLRAAALVAGADGFLEKPLGSVAAFQNEILVRLPVDERPRGLRPVDDTVVVPDAIALADDLAHVADLLENVDDGGTLGYVAGFVRGLGRSVKDAGLTRAAERMSAALDRGDPTEPHLITLTAMVHNRIEARAMAI
jgi:CheY-like chemotaxis protein